MKIHYRWVYNARISYVMGLDWIQVDTDMVSVKTFSLMYSKAHNSFVAGGWSLLLGYYE
jgi:hypothetical protein